MLLGTSATQALIRWRMKSKNWNRCFYLLSVDLISRACVQESGQRQTQCERALRDKKALEKELEKLTKHTPQETTQRGEVLHELQVKVHAAKRAKEDVTLKLDTALTSVKSLEVR